ncbi:MAG: hypothetical protein GWN71_24570, partial [Gammaproteobacteria bacterium]|nr:hypothetical protein [Gemmatimonadota bacterium]NIU76619.1 hypothetical protein [Gammaproteobacteria bacterium]NIX22397.1 hypothetical protein [Actinomycetota bacterium]
TRILDLQGQLLTEACAEFTIVLPDPPELITPANGAVVTAPQPVFQWTPIAAPPDLGLTYRVRIVERLPGQTPQTALQANIPTHEAEVADAPIL